MVYGLPWHPVDGQALARELEREVPRGHILFGAAVIAMARRRDRDDVLFELADGSGRVAEVHLTWAVEQDPACPRTTLYESIQDWKVSMLADHEDHGH